MEKNFVVKRTLDAVNYVMLVNDIASQHFYSSGEYVPHVGLLNSMRLFYNYCVVESKFDEKISHNSDSLDDIILLASDDDFIAEFNNALKATDRRLDFANAYLDAQDIVNTRKSSLHYAVELLGNALNAVVDRIAPSLTQENIDNIAKIANEIASGKPSAEALVEAYTKSLRMNQLFEVVRGDKQSENDG